MDKNTVYKELLKSKISANFSHYISGNLYYTVQLEDGLYQFSISVIEEHEIEFEDENLVVKTINLSSDLGTTPFKNEIKASELNRWIGKAIDMGNFIKIK